MKQSDIGIHKNSFVDFHREKHNRCSKVTVLTPLI